MTDQRALLSWIEDQIEFYTRAEDPQMVKDFNKLHKDVSKTLPEEFHAPADFATIVPLMQAVERFDSNDAALRLIAALGLGIEWDYPHVTVNFLRGDDMEPCYEQMEDSPDDREAEELRALRDVVFQAADQTMFRWSGIMDI